MPAIATPSVGVRERQPAAPRRTHDRHTLTLRMRVAASRAALTRQLAAGADPSSSPELSLRAEQLTSDKERKVLARSLRRTITEARQPSLTRVQGTLLRRRAVLEALEPLDIVIKRLVSPEPVAPEGMAIVERMITDGTWSPLYTAVAPGALRRLLVLANAALEPAEMAVN